ncbi:DUF354 domain-containing protein [Natronorarus salvus]|uniref:DUF354 domain-containing protein n=1 Tax=Natronorarus salvus TaxID=3117733 RepID=UPI002F260AC2
MRYVLFTNTPAHVHLYKHVVRRLLDGGHRVLVLAREYGCTLDLLEYYDLPYRSYGRCDTTKRSLIRNLPEQYATLIRETRRFDPDLIFGMGSYSAHAGLSSGTPTVLVLDSEPTGLDHRLSTPFARTILTPHTFRKDLGESHYRFTGYKECAYLHPEVFSPSTNVRDRLGLGEEVPYAIVRFNAFGSHHDVHARGFTDEQRYALIDHLSEHATVFVSDEGCGIDLEATEARPFDLHPAELHQALAGARLLVADSQTIVTEAALVGTPAIRSNSFVGDDDMGNFIELERNGLVRNLREFDAVLEAATAFATDPALGERVGRRRLDYLGGMVNLTDLLVEVAEGGGEVEGVRGIRRDSPTPGCLVH